MDFDYVIVGAGSSGAVLANRLSADPSVSVCLIEAGPPDRSPLIHIPIGVAKLFFSSKYNWRFKSTPQPHAKGREIYVPRGKTLGGSSSINGMIYTRGHPTDYDDWARLGNRGWSFREVLPYFRRSENNVDFPDSPFHGKGGELNVEFLDMYNPLCDVLFAAAEDQQFKQIEDFCGPDHEGFSRRQVTMKNGRRHSTAAAFLKPIRGRKNLTVLTETRTTRVIMKDRRATGVEVLRNGARETISARREVILSAGAFGSPQLLMLSGIGPAQELARHGIALVADMPAVGANLQEHVSVAVQWSSPTTVPWGISWKTWPWFAKEMVKYAVLRKGFFRNNMLHAGGFVKTDPALARPDMQLILMPTHRDAKGRMGWGHGYALIAIVLRPDSKGQVRLTSADPCADPEIDFNFLGDGRDVDCLVKGVEMARTLLDSPHFDPYKGEELSPGKGVSTRDGLAEFIRQNCVTVFHPVGTCAMGLGADSVVGPDLKVHGFEGLRVVDASVMPTLIGGNTNAPAIMIAEKAADMILGRQPPQPVPAELLGRGDLI